MPARPQSTSPLRDLALNYHDPQPRCWTFENSDKEEASRFQREVSAEPDVKARHLEDSNQVSAVSWQLDPHCATDSRQVTAVAPAVLSESWQVDPNYVRPQGSMPSSRFTSGSYPTTILSVDTNPTVQNPIRSSVNHRASINRASLQNSARDENEEVDHLTSLVPSKTWKKQSRTFNNTVHAGKSMSKLGPLVRSISNLSAHEIEASLHISSPRERLSYTSTGKHYGKESSEYTTDSHAGEFWRSATKVSNATLNSTKTIISNLSKSATSALSLGTLGTSQPSIGISSAGNRSNIDSTVQTHGLQRKPTFRASLVSSFSQAHIFQHYRRDSVSWRFLCPDNRSLVELFPQGHEKLGIKRWVTVVVMNPLLAAIVCMLLSNLFDIGLGHGFLIYEVLVRGASIRLPMVGISGFTSFLLYATDWSQWDIHFSLKGAPVLLVFYLWMATGACFTFEFPFLPLAIAMLHLPLTIMFFRMSQFRMCYNVFFYNAVSISCFIVSLILLGLWCIWVFTAERGWTPSTKDWLQGRMEGLHDAYGVQNWDKCKDENPRPECAKLELIAFLVWSCPLFQGITYLLMAGICHFRAWFLSKHEFKQFSIIITFASTVVVILIGAFWVCVSIAGADGEISMAILVIIGVCALSLCAWAYSSLVISDLIEYTVQMPIVMALKPMVNSDEFKGCVLCGAVGLVVPFLVMEILVRITQRFFLCRSGTHPFLTERALHLIHGVKGWHWGAVLEQAFLWSVFFVIVWVAGGQLATVFLVWVREKLLFMHAVPYVFIVVLVTLVLFLLPPIPGMLVYLSTSITIVAKAKEDRNFGLGILVAALSSLFLKMTAFGIEQSIFGRLLRRSMMVQRNWGPRNCWARAIEKIMNEPGLSIKKSLLVCGGPDWPCGVLLGVLPIGVKQPLLHLLPCTVIIVLATVSGAMIQDDDWHTGGVIMLRVATMLQGMLMTLACMLVLSVMHHQAEDLQSTRSDIEMVNKYVARQARSTRIYVLCTEWDSLGIVCRVLLASGTGLEILSCWVFFFCSSACFQKFDINSKFDAPLEEDGLGGNALNVFRPLGIVCLSIAVLGWINMGGYYFMVYRHTRRVLHGCEMHQKLATQQSKLSKQVSNGSKRSGSRVSKPMTNTRSTATSVNSLKRPSMENTLHMSDTDSLHVLKTEYSRLSTPFFDRMQNDRMQCPDGTSSETSYTSGNSWQRGTPCKLEPKVLR